MPSRYDAKAKPRTVSARTGAPSWPALSRRSPGPVAGFPPVSVRSVAVAIYGSYASPSAACATCRLKTAPLGSPVLLAVGPAVMRPNRTARNVPSPSTTQMSSKDEHLRVRAEELHYVAHLPLGVRRADVTKKNRRRPTLPGPCGPSTIGAEGLNCSVRNGKRCFPLAIATGNWRETSPPAVLQNCTAPHERASQSKNPSSPRPISTGLLRTSPPFQIRPINLVVYQGSYSL